MNRNKKITQTMALAMTGIMIANAGMGSVYAADQTASVEKETESTTEAGATDESTWQFGWRVNFKNQYVSSGTGGLAKSHGKQCI